MISTFTKTLTNRCEIVMKKILIIDDSKFSRMRVRQFLEQDYFEIIEAENGLVGLELIQTEQPDCILCDNARDERYGVT